jgi:hypothetical protein
MNGAEQYLITEAKNEMMTNCCRCLIEMLGYSWQKVIEKNTVEQHYISVFVQWY